MHRETAVKRSFRVVIECEMEVHELTHERVLADYEERVRHAAECDVCGEVEPVMPSDQSIEDQLALQQALLRDPVRLAEWLRHELASHLNAMGLDQCESESTDAEILKPIVESLPPRARHRFRQAMARDELAETAEDFFETFTFRVAEVEIEE
jgi:hypothetical protein